MAGVYEMYNLETNTLEKFVIGIILIIVITVYQCFILK